MALKIVTWNMNYAFRKGQVDAAWEYLRSLEADIALLQETAPPRDTENAVWHQVLKGWGTAVVARDGLDWKEVPSVPVDGDDAIPRGHLERTHRGAWAAADVEIPDLGAVTAVSVYGLMYKVGNGITYSTVSLQRTLSDLTPVLNVHYGKGRLAVMGGDLNMTPQIPPPDRKAHTAILDRIKAFGLVDCLGETHEGFVRTYRHQNKPTGTPWQDDWVFASPKLKLVTCEPLDLEAAWALSDHCPVIAEFET